MRQTAALIGAVVGVFGIAAASAEPVRLPATDFSSQAAPNQKKKVGPPVAPRGNINVNQNVNRNLNVNRNVNQNANRNLNANRNVNQNINVNRNVNRNVNQNINVNRNQNININRRVGGPVPAPQFQGGGRAGNVRLGVGGTAVRFNAGPGRVMPYRAVNVPMMRIGPKVAPVWKGQKKFYYGGKWKTFVPLAALGAVAIGGAYYYADSYVTVARPYCTGVSPEGCRLNWQRVEFEEGDSEWQCVSFCRRPGAPPPARTVALVSPPPITQGSCELAIFSEPGFGGTNATSNDEQPRLSQLGWRDQIASVKVAAGTWDFFSGEDFTGEVVRYGPGEYAELGPEWTRKAGSFMCVQP